MTPQYLDIFMPIQNKNEKYFGLKIKSSQDDLLKICFVNFQNDINSLFISKTIIPKRKFRVAVTPWCGWQCDILYVHQITSTVPQTWILFFFIISFSILPRFISFNANFNLFFSWRELKWDLLHYSLCKTKFSFYCYHSTCKQTKMHVRYHQINWKNGP